MDSSSIVSKPPTTNPPHHLYYFQHHRNLKQRFLSLLRRFRVSESSDEESTPDEYAPHGSEGPQASHLHMEELRLLEVFVLSVNTPILNIFFFQTLLTLYLFNALGAIRAHLMLDTVRAMDMCLLRMLCLMISSLTYVYMIMTI